MHNPLSRFAVYWLLSKPSPRSQSGFTLIEMLVVIIFAGVLAAIAAPSWNVLVARQRSSAVRNDITQLLRQAQADARRTRSARAIVFDTRATAPLPRATIVPLAPAIPPATLTIPTPETIGDSADQWRVLGGSDIPKGSVVLSGFGSGGNNTTIVLDSNGTIATAQTLSGIPEQLAAPFIISTVTPPDVRRCVIIQTLLGSFRTSDKSAECKR